MKEYKYIYIKGKRMYLHVHLIHTYVAIEDLKPFDSIFKIWIKFFFSLIGKLHLHPMGFKSRNSPVTTHSCEMRKCHLC